jgi:hypothetical protein
MLSSQCPAIANADTSPRKASAPSVEDVWGVTEPEMAAYKSLVLPDRIELCPPQFNALKEKEFSLSLSLLVYQRGDQNGSPVVCYTIAHLAYRPGE